MAEPAPLAPVEKAALAVVGLCVAFCLQFPFLTGPALARTYADSGSALPAVTELALTTWFPLMLGLNPASVAFYALAGPHPARRRLFLLVAAVMALGVGGVFAAAWSRSG